jgi:DNA mismatch endonuclease, patch repair protein
VRKSPSYKDLTPASASASRAMRGNRQKNTTPELLLRRGLRRLGARFRTNVEELPGQPDMAFTRARVAVFCDGDFWHGRHWEKLKAVLGKRANSSYWVAKIAYNIKRDARLRRALRRKGWRVFRFWETDIRNDPYRIARRLLTLVRKRR